VVLPAPGSVPAGSLDNRELDKLVGTLGRNKATWRRALVLSQWLQDSGHVLDDRLCTTVRPAAVQPCTVACCVAGLHCCISFVVLWCAVVRSTGSGIVA
jgi:hypothetical protein